MEKIIPQLLGLIYYIFESLCLSLISFTFIGFTPERKKLMLFAVTFGISTFILRDLLMPFFNLAIGLHSFILFILNLALLTFIFRLPFIISAICDILYFITIILSETLTFTFYKLLGYAPAMVFSSVAFMNICRWSSLVLILLLILLLKKTEFTLIPLSKVFGLNRDE